MFPIPWYVVLLVSIPESILVTIIGFALFNLEISYKNIILIALAGSLACYLIRLFNTINGIQTLVWIGTMIIFGFLLSKIDIWKVSVAILAGVTIDGVIQSILLQVGLKITSQNPTNMIADPMLLIIFFIPEAIILFSIYLLVIRTKSILYDGSMEDLK